MITYAPLPKWKDLIMALFPANVDDRTLASSWCGDDDNPFWFSRSAWAMRAIALWWEVFFQRKAPSIWIPDYFCNQSLYPLRKTSLNITFYPITEQLQPEWNSCNSLAKENPPDIFVIVHYFGYPADTKGARNFCKTHKTLLVEDAAHVLTPTSQIGHEGDFVFYSPHKLLPVPDGSVLILRSKSEIFKNESTEKALEVMNDIVKGVNFPASTPWKWVAKRAVQKLMPDSLSRVINKNSRTAFDKDTKYATASTQVGLSKFARRLLWFTQKDIKAISFFRNNNSSIIEYTFRTKNGLSPYFDRKVQDWTPYLSIFRCSSLEIAKNQFEHIKRSGCPVQSWPDLPPEIMENPDVHKSAINSRRTLIVIPIHHSFNASNLGNKYSSKGFKSHKDMNKRYRIIWNELDQNAWDTLFGSVEMSNLLQSWAYGSAKAESEGWSVRRGQVQRDGSTIAIVQVLEKWLPIIGKISRINRGPLWLNKPESLDVIDAVYALVYKQWKWWKGKALLIAPELQNAPQNMMILSSLGYRSRLKSGWRSTLLDLSKKIEELRDNLHSKWRNQLRVAEKSGLRVVISCHEEDFDWISGKYEELMLKKNFKGISIKLLSSLRNCLNNKEHLLLFKAIYEEKAVAGILIAMHGKTCTYLVGWNGIEGRKINATNFLLWNAILVMKGRGCLWFDSGGIDNINTPDIAKFKRGMGGEEYELIGEYICI